MLIHRDVLGVILEWNCNVKEALCFIPKKVDATNVSEYCHISAVTTFVYKIMVKGILGRSNEFSCMVFFTTNQLLQIARLLIFLFFLSHPIARLLIDEEWVNGDVRRGYSIMYISCVLQ